jgi:hypothetical protein
VTHREPAEFRNIDLEVDADEDLAVLATALEPGVFRNYLGGFDGRQRLSVAARVHVEHAGDADRYAGHLLDCIEALPETAATLWRRARSRTFDYGFDGGNDGGPLTLDVREDLLRRMVAAGVAIRITVYPYTAPRG